MATVSIEPTTRAASAGFSVSARVRTGAEYARVFKHGRRVTHPLLALHVLHDADPRGARLGLAVSRKVDPNATGRNRIKRVLRDAFRHARVELAPGAYVVVARAAAREAGNDALRAAFLQSIGRAAALPPPATTGTMPPPP